MTKVPYPNIGIYFVDQSSGVYMIGTFVIKELRKYQINKMDKHSPVYYFQKYF